MAAPSVALLYGDGVSPETLTQIAGHHGWQLAPQGSAPNGHDGRHVLLLGKVDGGKLGPALATPYHAYVELIGDGAQLNPETSEAVSSGKLCFSLATDTAYQMDSAALICDALTARGVLTPMRRPDVELSLHETISNAVVHGNLKLESNMKGDAGNFAKFAQELQQRMTSPEAKRRVDIIASWDHEFLDISVMDKGDGYDESKLPANVDPFAPAGRGLAIIRSLTLAMNVTHGGRVTTLRFLT
jgi:hypothetical protein